MADIPMSRAEAALEKIEEYLNLASAWVIVFMLFIVSISVILRMTLNRPIVMVYEGVELGMIILVFLGMAYTQRRGKNASVILFYSRFPERVRMYLDSIVLFLSACFWGLLTWQSLLRTIKSWQMMESSIAVVSFPQYPGWTMIPLGAGFLTIELLLQFYKSLLKFKSSPQRH
jgi:TRAP-type C4-dicarboxylate transport system permease small subunit